ncbi:tetratricopeptide repeat protein [Vibrio porteresiae]|uniref:Type IV pilus biogenesis/stability protein PilW n=1 Tax=Vibrio porteresiae DSM 19223 TaxID=1123496 RepID=A0ABZ0QIX9_9VIBR|nr:hypothetical protein [Vibrio porteresiae]WPC76463.1 hypothetical protein R8Z52_18210 [Vibrio porteresiae DSM 19223]
MSKMIVVTLLLISLSGCVATSGKRNGGIDTQTQEKVLLSSKNYQKLITFYKSQLLAKEDFATRIKLIRAYVETADFHSAIFYLEPLLNTKKESFDVNYLAGKSYLNLGDLDRANRYLTQANRLNPREADVLNLLGINDCYRGEFYQAKQRFLQARVFMDDDITVKNNLALVAILQQHYFTAKDLLEPMYFSNANGSQRIKANLAIVYAKLGDMGGFTRLTTTLSPEQRNKLFANLKALKLSDVKRAVLGSPEKQQEELSEKR